MAENSNAPEPWETPGAPHAETELPSEFYEGATPETATALVPESPDWAAPSAAPTEPVETRHFPVAIGALLVLTLLAAVMVSRQPTPPPPTTAPVAAEPPSASTPATPAPGSAEAPAKESAVTALASSVDSLKTEVTELSKQIKALKGQVDAEPKIDLGPLQTKVDSLAKTSAAGAGVIEKVSALDKRLGTIDQSLQRAVGALRDDVDALKSDLKHVGEKADTAAKLAAEKPAPAATAAPPARSAPTITPPAEAKDNSLADVADPFKAGKYKDALDAFRAVENKDPKDARLWYYAAMSNGMATSDWKGETERLLKKGIERESAATPKAAEIDAEFANLPARLKTWFDYWRKNPPK
jgi:TolA-binding protein